MNTSIRVCARAFTALLVLSAIGFAAVPSATAEVVVAAVPAAPQEIELVAGSDSSITVEWEASPGATSYRVYRGTASGGEGTTPIATTTEHEYKDNNLSPTPVYYYQVTAVNSDRRVTAFGRGRLQDTASHRHRRHHPGRARGQLDGLLLQGRPARRLRLVQNPQRLVPVDPGLLRLQLPRRPSRRHGLRRRRLHDLQQRRRTHHRPLQRRRGATPSRAGCSPESTTGRWA